MKHSTMYVKSVNYFERRKKNFKYGGWMRLKVQVIYFYSIHSRERTSLNDQQYLKLHCEFSNKK